VITPKKIDPYFLYCYLTTPEFVKYLTQIAETHTSAYPSFKPEVIENARIHFPSNLQEQRKISIFLRNFEDKIECNIRIAKILDDLCNLIFKMHFSMNENRPDLKIDRLKNHIKFIKGRKPGKMRYNKQEGDLPVILINSIDTGNFLYSNPKNQILCNEKDVLMVLDGASSGRVEKGYEGIIGSTLAKLLVVSNSITKEFLYLYLKEKYNQINYNVTGSAIPHADKRYILSLKILIPDNETLESFQKIIEPYFEYRRILRKENYFLNELINNIKTNLISGRLKTKKVL
ncbi:MAG: restriction endonuclease subunit S, partial [Candidatus Hodarchaeota archaeon]